MRLEHHDTGDRTGPDRARALGRAIAGPVRAAATAYADHYRALGIPPESVAEVVDGSLRAVEAWAPHLAEEMAALAGGAGVPVRDVAALNARTEVLATATLAEECSTAVRVPAQGDVVAFQTWDWNAELARVGVVWRYRTDAGRRVETFTEPGILAKIGVNDAGLSVNFNILAHASDTGRDGVPVHVVARRVLDEATSLAEARAIAASAAVSASSVLTVVAPEGAEALEIAPAGVGGVAPDRGWLLHTNHFLDPVLAEGGRIRPDSTTAARYAALATAAARDVDTSTAAAMAAGLCGPDSAGSPLCMRGDPAVAPHQRTETLLTVRIVPARGEMTCHAGPPADLVAREAAQPLSTS